MRRQLETVRNEYKALPGVTHATGAFLRPGRVSYVDVRDVIPEGGTGKRRLHYMGTDEEFFDTFEVPFVAGGLPNPDQLWKSISESEGIRSIVINERAAEVLGWKGDAIGKRFYEDWERQDGTTYRRWSEIKGVVKDYHNESLHTGIRPMLIDVAGSVKFVAVRLGKGDIKETMEGIEAVWDKFMGGIPFEFQFADDLIQDRYLAELQLRQVLRFFSGLSILVGCLGVLGLVSFTARQRTKEIGIRKVLGSDNIGIVRLLSTDFVRLSLVSFLVAWPIAYVIGADWLSSFPYRVNLGPLPFVTSGLFIIGLPAITVGIQSWRSATQDPVISLRQEYPFISSFALEIPRRSSGQAFPINSWCHNALQKTHLRRHCLRRHQARFPQVDPPWRQGRQPHQDANRSAGNTEGDSRRTGPNYESGRKAGR